MTGYNTGTTGGAGGISHSTPFTYTIPAGVAVNDVMIITITTFAYPNTTPSFATPTSGGGSWQQIGTTLSCVQGGSFNVFGTSWWRVATASDPSSTFSISYTGAVGTTDAIYWSSTLESYTGFYTTAPIGNVITLTGQNTPFSPAATTTSAASSWGLYLGPMACSSGGSVTAEPGTLRHNANTSGIACVSSDSNGSVGGVGSTIGGATPGSWNTSAGTGSGAMGFTVELRTQAPPAPVTAQPLPPRIPHPRFLDVMLEEAYQRADWQSQGVASLQQQHWRLMDGVNGRPGAYSGGNTIFGQGATGATLTADTNSYTLGMEFNTTQAASAVAVWFYSPSGAVILPGAIGIYQVSSTSLIHSETAVWSGAAGSGWVRAIFNNPPALTSGTLYKVVVSSSGGSNWYSGTNNYWGTGPGQNGLSNGILFAQNNAAASPGQGSFATSTLTYPGTTFQQSNYWVDVEVVAESVGSVAPNTATSASGNLVNGLSFYPNQPGTWFEGYWWWVTSTGGQPTAPQKFALWSQYTGGGSLAGTVVPGTVVTSGTLSPGWNWVPLPQPVQLSVWGTYIAATGVNGPCPQTINQFNSGGPYQAGITSGPITAFSDGTGTNPIPGPYTGNGCATTGGSDPSQAMPGGDAGAGDLLWLDVQVTNTPPAGYNKSYRLWPNMADADWNTSADSPVNYVIGTEVILSQASVVNAIWYYVPNGMGSSGNQWATSADVWNVRTGVRVATQQNPVWINPVTGGVDKNSNTGRWVYTQLPSTVYLAPGDYYVTVYNGNASPNGWGSKRLGYWEAWANPSNGTYQNTPPAPNGITNGPLYAPPTPLASTIQDYTNPSQVEPGQSVFAVGPPNQFPNRYVGSAPGQSNLYQNYWVDLEVTPASTYAPDTPAPPSIPHPMWQDFLEAAEARLDNGTAPPANANVGGLVANVSVVAPMGTPSGSTNVTGLTANVNVVAPSGIANTNVNGAAAGVSVAAPDGNPNISVPGSVANVTVAAPAGTVTARVNGLAANVSVAAPTGVSSVTTAGPGPANVTVAAPTGTAIGGANVNGLAAAVSVSAPAGTASVSTAGLASAVSVAGPAGTQSVSTPGSVGIVTVAAPTGTASTSGGGPVINGLVASVTVAALPGVISVSTGGQAGLVAVAAPAGFASNGSISMLSVTAGCAFQAYSSISAQATMEFEAGQPVQGGLSTFASDPWISMYPG